MNNKKQIPFTIWLLALNAVRVTRFFFFFSFSPFFSICKVKQTKASVIYVLEKKGLLKKCKSLKKNAVLPEI